jgi:hypothetical protein
MDNAKFYGCVNGCNDCEGFSNCRLRKLTGSSFKLPERAFCSICGKMIVHEESINESDYIITKFLNFHNPEFSLCLQMHPQCLPKFENFIIESNKNLKK